MQSLVSHNLWPRIKSLAKKSKRRMAAIAYVTSDDYIRFKRGDTLIVDASDASIESGETSAKVLRAAYKRKARLFHLPGLHAKIIVCDRTAVIGSANASTSSTRLVEAALITDDAATVGQAVGMIDQLTEIAKEINDAFLSRIEAIKVKRRGGLRTQKAKQVNVRLPASRTWLINVTERDEESHPNEKSQAEAGMKIAEARLSSTRDDISWIRWTGDSRFCKEAQQGDSVIQIWRRKGGKRWWVYRHAPILHKQVEPMCTRFYVVDAKDSEDTAMPLGAFKELASRVRLPGRVGPYSCREIDEHFARAMDTLWMA